MSLPTPADDGKYPFPIEDGGTFIDIAFRAQQNREWLIKESTALCYAAGLIEADDPDLLVKDFVTIADAPMSLILYFLMFSCH